MTVQDHAASLPADARRQRRERDRDTWRQSWTQFSLSAALAVLIIWSWTGSDIDVTRLAESGGRIAEFLGRMFPPDLSVLPVVIESSAETLRIAVLGTLGCVLLSIVFGLLDYRALVRRGVPQPFHWAFSFFVLLFATAAVAYPVGRMIVARRRGADGGLAAMIVAIAVQLVVLVVSLVAYSKLGAGWGRFAALLRAGGLLNDEEVRRISRIAVEDQAA